MLILAYAGTVGGFLIYLKGLNERADKERMYLLNRVQAPEAAVAMSLSEDVGGQKLHVSVDDDEDFQKNLEALESWQP